MRSSNFLFPILVLLALWYLLSKKPLVAGGGVGSTLGKSGEPAAVRNNNPLNIRVSGTAWKGKLAQRPAGTDARFEVFSTWVLGLRAGMVNMRTWYGRGKVTLRLLLNTWAPPSDGNDTNIYVDFVSKSSGIGPDSPFIWNKETIRKIIKPMAQMEAGKPTVVDSDFDTAWSMLSA